MEVRKTETDQGRCRDAPADNPAYRSHSVSHSGFVTTPFGDCMCSHLLTGQPCSRSTTPPSQGIFLSNADTVVTKLRKGRGEFLEMASLHLSMRIHSQKVALPVDTSIEAVFSCNPIVLNAVNYMEM
jgi:hypothetical protein